MVTVLNNVTAIAASRQLGITQMGLKQAIERLTTGKRVNRASDDASAMVAGNTAEASARSTAASVVGHQVAYFKAQASDASFDEATNLAYRMAEIEGGGNTAVGTEYSSLITQVQGIATSLSGVTDSTTALAAIATARQGFAATMSTEQSAANLAGIQSESSQSISDAYLGADMGKEMANLTKYQILMTAGTSALSNANSSSQTLTGIFR